MSSLGKILTQYSMSKSITAISKYCILKNCNTLVASTRPISSQFVFLQFSDTVPPAKKGIIASEKERRNFLELFPDIVQDLTRIGTGTIGDTSEAQKWNAKVLQGNVLGGKLNRGLAVSLSLKKIVEPNTVDDKSIRKANILGWCIELLQSHLLVADDIIDGSELRRGKECWYKKVGISAVNDSLLLNADVYKLLKINFKNDSYYTDVLDLFHEAYLKTVIGQCLDMQSCPIGGRPNFNLFTMDHYHSIVKYKTAFYSFYLPVAIAMYMAGIMDNDKARVAGITDRELHRQARTILLEMGIFYQSQDDYLDLYGNPVETGKIGTDIANGKCSWLAVVALQRASSKQRKIMQEHYGKDERDSVKIIEDLYKDLKIKAAYKVYEESTTSRIRTHIQQISRGLNHNIFFSFLDKIYQRSS